MKIAIHHTKGSFSDRWIAYCEKQGIAYKIVDCYKNDIIQQLEDCTALMWHYHHAGAKSFLFAKQLMYAVSAMGKKIFPDFNTAWHFDDKVGQKYLLEGIGAPLVPSYVFYTRQEALEWINNSSFPKVFKLRSGASSANVSLVRTKQDAIRMTNKAFGAGFTQYNGWPNFKERLRKFKKGQTTFFDVCKGFVRIFHHTEFSKVAGREKGYIYFQEFIPNNDSDIRVIVVDKKAFAIKRMVRENDFRASGGGTILYDKELFDTATIQLALDVTQQLNAQCLAFDFVYKDGKPLIIEISYGYANEAYDPVQGYWDKALNWHEGPLVSQHWMVDMMVR
jgi:glutathione synthase/RimK-type ligase-like ATP-grasp enzyme